MESTYFDTPAPPYASRTGIKGRQQGAALLVSLVMLVMVLMLGISAAQIALQGEKASRSDRDHQIALQAAEAALMDAELEIEGASTAGQGRGLGFKFASDRSDGFTDGCGNDTATLGLCNRAADGAPPIWQTVDFMNDTANSSTVPYGRFTGQSFQTGQGSLSARVPRYIIELMRDNKDGGDATALTFFYRITAIGFGTRDTTQVVLQTFYRKDGR